MSDLQVNCLEKSPLEKNSKISQITRWLLAFNFFVSFFEPYINKVIGSVGKFYIFAVIIIVAFTAKHVRFRYYHVIYALWFIYKIVSVFWTRDFTIFQMHAVSQIGMIVLLICLTMVYIDLKTMNWIINSLWAGSALFGFLSLFFSEPYLFENESRQVLTLFGQQVDPNNQGAFVVIGIAVSLYYLFYLKEYRLLSLVVLSINTYSLLVTGSRSGLVAFVAIVIVFFYLYFKSYNYKRKSLKNKMQTIAIMLLAGLVIFYITNNLLYADTFNRLFEFDGYEGGSDRTAIWSITWDLISQGVNFIFGAGWGSYYGYSGMYDVVHNTFLSILCDTGIIGLIVFLFPLFVAGVYLFKKKDVLAISIFVSGMVPAFFIEAINKRFYWHSIIFLLISYNFTIENKHTIDQYKQNSKEGRK